MMTESGGSREGRYPRCGDSVYVRLAVLAGREYALVQQYEPSLCEEPEPCESTSAGESGSAEEPRHC